MKSLLFVIIMMTVYSKQKHPDPFTEIQKDRQLQQYITVPKEEPFHIGACAISTSMHTIGVPIMQFKSGDKVISKMALKDATYEAIIEELESLKYMDVCK